VNAKKKAKYRSELFSLKVTFQTISFQNERKTKTALFDFKYKTVFYTSNTNNFKIKYTDESTINYLEEEDLQFLIDGGGNNVKEEGFSKKVLIMNNKTAE